MIPLLGSALIRFLWQGAALGGLLFIFLLLSRNARIRYAAAATVLALMALCPPATMLFLQQPSIVLAVSSPPAVLPMAASLISPIPAESFDWLRAFVLIWCGGVLLFAARALGGWVILQKLRRSAHETVPASILKQCLRLQERVGIRKVIRFADCACMGGPAVIGWFRPIVLLPIAALAGLSSEQLEAVIAHELAHIKRYDAVVNFFQISVETLLFYHPAIWWVNRVIRTERENCCDDVAVSVCGNAHEYARALTALAGQNARAAWAMAATGGALKERVARLLGSPKISHGLPRAGFVLAATFCLACVLAASTCTQQDPAPPPAPPPPAVPPPPPPPPTKPSLPFALAAPEPDARKDLSAFLEQKEEFEAQEQELKAAADRLHALELQLGQQSGDKSRNATEIYQAKADLDKRMQELEAMAAELQKRHALEALLMRAEGLRAAADKSRYEAPSHFSSADLATLKAQGVSEDFVRLMHSVCLPDLPASGYINAQRQGISEEFLEKVRSHNFQNLTLAQLLTLKDSGVL